MSRGPQDSSATALPAKVPSPDELATILEVNSSSSEADKAKEGWIMSVSKTFCGATGALMAADGKFGPKKMDATLLDILHEAEESEAKKSHPGRKEKIAEYREMIAIKGCGNVTMSQLLSHRSGLTQGNHYSISGNLSNVELFTESYEHEDPKTKLPTKSAIVTFDPAKTGKVFSYCNPGFVLAEDMMSLVADSERGYYGELQDRIIEPLGLKNTKSIYESEENICEEGVRVEGVIPFPQIKTTLPH